MKYIVQFSCDPEAVSYDIEFGNDSEGIRIRFGAGDGSSKAWPLLPDEVEPLLHGVDNEMLVPGWWMKRW
jgi:hypothetical protein